MGPQGGEALLDAPIPATWLQMAISNEDLALHLLQDIQEPGTGGRTAATSGTVADMDYVADVSVMAQDAAGAKGGVFTKGVEDRLDEGPKGIGDNPNLHEEDAVGGDPPAKVDDTLIQGQSAAGQLFEVLHQQLGLAIIKE